MAIIAKETITTIEKDTQKSGIKRIAELANVSIGTVDRVLHNRPGVAQKTKDEVLKIIKELNYEPNILARRLVSKKLYRLVVLIPKSSEENPFWNSHITGINAAADEIKQYGVLLDKLTFNQNDVNDFLKICKKVKNEEYDGILMVPFFYDESLAFLEYCKEKTIPVVFFDTNISQSEILSYVGQDAYKSGYLAGNLISYLLQPKETVLVVSINATKKSNNHVNYLKREEGFKNCAAQKNAFHIKVLNHNSEEETNSLEEEILEYLKNDLSIKVIFVTNSRVYKVSEILVKHKIKTVKLVGYDLIEKNIHYLNNGHIDFLISQEPIKQGYTGIMALFKNLILKQPVEKETYMPIDIIMKDNLKFYSS